MRFGSVLVWLAAFAAGVQAQGGLATLAEHMPQCSLACFMEAIPASSCVTNLTSECLCTNKALNLAVATCAQKTCTIYELLQTKNVSNKGCGVPDRYNGQKFIIGGVVGCALAILSFVLRMAASIGRNGRQVSWDDATMLIVVGLAIPPTIFIRDLINNGLGRDLWTLKDYQISNVLRYYFYGEVFYVTALGISKISILFFYLRVFPDKQFKIITYTVMGISAAYTIAFFFATLFQCSPISMAWDQWDGLHKGKCNNIHLQGWIAAAINILLDTVVMILPMKHLAGLNMSIRKKVMVMAMFGVGIFVIVVSVIRLYSLIRFANTQNITWDYVDAGLWSLIEIDVSIVCGCMPAHRFLIGKLWPKMKTTIRSSKNNSSKGTTNTTSSSIVGKMARVSIKAISRDDSFIPLSDIDGNSDIAYLTKAAEMPSGKESSAWITQTNEVDLDHSNALRGPKNDRPQDWNWPTAGKEHV